MLYSHPALRKLSRAQLADMDRPMWKRVRAASGDDLAMRDLMLRSHGWQTLHNIIRGAHGLPNRY